jgi:hypothetical protein
VRVREARSALLAGMHLRAKQRKGLDIRTPMTLRAFRLGSRGEYWHTARRSLLV